MHGSRNGEDALMVEFFFHDEKTGEIVATGMCLERDFDIQSDPRGVKKKGRADIRTDYFDLASRTVKRKPPQPSPNHEFDYATRQWQLNVEKAWAAVRAERDKRLLASDWTQLPDVPLEKKAAWAVYRQALRDVTQQTDPLNITWPDYPA